MLRISTLLFGLCLLPLNLVADNEPSPESAAKAKPTTGKIVGGEKSNEGDWPFVAALLYADESDQLNAQFCAGALIDPYWILTAAHCVQGVNPSAIQVAVGRTNLYDIAPEDRVNVIDIIIHPDFQNPTISGDAALLLLDRPILATETIALAYDEIHYLPDSVSTVIGWGDTSPNDETDYPFELREVEIPIVSRETANQPEVWNGDLPASAFAAGYEDGGRDTCSGDSGGPLLVYDNVLERWLLAGITSGSPSQKRCGDAFNYGSYTDVHKLQDWIYDHIHPEFLTWLQLNDTRQPYANPDGDGLANWEEFFFGTDPLNSDSPTFKAHVVQDNGIAYPAIEYTGTKFSMLSLAAEFSSELTNWNTLAFANSGTISEFTHINGIEQKRVIARSKQSFAELGDNALFFKPHAAWTGFLETNGRRLLAGKHTQGRLLSMDQRENGYYSREYRLHFDESTAPINLSLRSIDFDARLTVRNESGSVTLADSSNSGGGEDDLISFTPAPDENYFVEVSTESPEKRGNFILSAFQNLPPTTTLSENQEIQSTLRNTDDSDPLYPFSTYYKQDFLIQGANPGDRIRVRLESSSFEPSLSLVHAETSRVIDEQIPYEGDSYVEMDYTVERNGPLLARATTMVSEETGDFAISYSKISLPSIRLGDVVNGTISSTDDIDPLFEDVYYKDDYALTLLQDGTLVRVTMTSNVIDSYLSIIDANSGAQIAGNDDSGGELNSRVEFTYDSNIRYIIRASTAGIEETGSYTLRVN